MNNHGETIEAAARIGWRQEEDALLFACVNSARKGNLPLKTVFEEVAARTGRKPNSIRNYYYARVKQGGETGAQAAHNPAFVAFTEGEINTLLRTVLGARARGVSVRACTLAMGNGDNRAMLRYQNKYRSLLKSSPAVVMAVLREMRAEGLPAYDPF